MKKKVFLLGLALRFLAAPAPSFAAPSGHHGGHAPVVRASNYHGGAHRPPMHASVSLGHHHIAGRPLPPPVIRPYRPLFRPYYSYYPATYYTSYSYYPVTSYEVVETVPAPVDTVVVKDNYAGINTAANVINAAANVAATIRYLTW